MYEWSVWYMYMYKNLAFEASLKNRGILYFAACGCV